jgi:hypothetical protein
MMAIPPQEAELFTVERHEADGVMHLTLEGVIDEFADLSFFAHLHGRVMVHLRGVRRINSFGVRLWIDATRSIPADVEATFVEVSAAIVEQVNLVTGFFGAGQMTSFVAPLTCPGCSFTTDQIFAVSDCTSPGSSVRLPARRCPSCGGALELDDIEEQFLAFLR